MKVGRMSAAQFPLPGIAVFILSVGFAWLAFAGLMSLVSKRWPNNPITDAYNDVYGSGSVN